MHMYVLVYIYTRTHATKGNVRVSKCTDKSLGLPEGYTACSLTDIHSQDNRLALDDAVHSLILEPMHSEVTS